MNKKIIIVVVLVIIAVAFFYPKNIGRGSCGYCAKDEYKWTERYASCLGFKHITAGCNILGFGNYCTDAANELLCYGIPYDHSNQLGGYTCYNSSIEPRIEIPCNLME